MNILTNHSLKALNTFHIDCQAHRFATFASKTELTELLHTLKKEEPLYVLGGGSNTLFVRPFKGLILHPEEKDIQIVDKKGEYVWVRASAGTVWDDFVQFCIDSGLWGAENLSFIPGTVGASPVQNIGAYSCEAKDIIDSVEFYHLEKNRFETIKGENCAFGYRDSIFKHALKGKAIVTSVTYLLTEIPSPNLKYQQIEEAVKTLGAPSLYNIRKAIIDIRQRKLPDPNEIGNGGSFFKNPVVSQEQVTSLINQYPEMPAYPVENGVKLSAAWLIDQAGWKGYRDGDVGVHDKQALVLVNYGNAQGKDVLSLSRRITEDVAEKFGVMLEPEINIV